MAIRVLIADDHGVLRAGLRALLNSEDGFEVVGEAGDSDEALAQVVQLKPDVALLDVSMPGCGGIEVTRAIRRVHPDTRVLILTVHEDEGLLREAMRAGAAGYIVKRAMESELIDALRAIWKGELYVHPSMLRGLLQDGAALGAGGPQNSVEELTPRETEVLRHVAHGYTNRQTAERLGISVRTVESHRANVMGKLGLSSRVELVRYAREAGIFD